MPETERAADETAVVLVIHVVRTGGIAGMRREWTAEPPADDAPRWIALIDDCPWDDPDPGSSRGADRFVWAISARFRDRADRSIRLPDAQVTGPWRSLVDEVRGAAAPAPAPSPSAGPPPR